MPPQYIDPLTMPITKMGDTPIFLKDIINLTNEHYNDSKKGIQADASRYRPILQKLIDERDALFKETHDYESTYGKYLPSLESLDESIKTGILDFRPDNPLYLYHSDNNDIRSKLNVLYNLTLKDKGYSGRLYEQTLKALDLPEIKNYTESLFSQQLSKQDKAIQASEHHRKEQAPSNPNETIRPEGLLQILQYILKNPSRIPGELLQ